MANTWMARTGSATAAGAVAFASNKQMISIFNLVGSGVVCNVYRIWALNNQTAGVTSVSPFATPITINRCTTSQTTEAGITGGTVITPLAFDTTNTALTNKVACYTGATTNYSTVANSTYRRIFIPNDEPAVTTLTPDEYWNIPMICEIFNPGFRDTNAEPIVLRPGEGLEVRQPGTNAVGIYQFNIQFTVV